MTQGSLARDFRAEKNCRLNYSLEAPYSTASAGSLSYTMKNAAGATVATVAIDSTAKTTTITCSGASPVVVPSNCDSGSDAASSSATCTTGSCAF